DLGARESLARSYLRRTIASRCKKRLRAIGGKTNNRPFAAQISRSGQYSSRPQGSSRKCWGRSLGSICKSIREDVTRIVTAQRDHVDRGTASNFAEDER